MLADDPCLLARGKRGGVQLRRVILDSQARTPLDAQVISDGREEHTTVVVLREHQPSGGGTKAAG